jgi:hypothetical protein
MTTTAIIIAAIFKMSLCNLPFNIEKYCKTNIAVTFYKNKELLSLIPLSLLPWRRDGASSL